MADFELTANEKTSLSQLSRRLVERSARLDAEDNESLKLTTDVDPFSAEGQLLRMLDLEKKLESIRADWSKNLNAVISTVERFEARLSRVDGELQGLHNREEKLERLVERHSEDLTRSTTMFAEVAAIRIEKALERVEAVLSKHSVSTPPTGPALEGNVIQRG